jgi:hypoxanthine phosphoribosyltransferase
MLVSHNANLTAHPDIDKVLINEDQIRVRVKELGRQISQDYAKNRVTLIGILKGSLFFLSDLMRAIDVDCRVDFMSLSSYSAAKSTGAVRLVLDLKEVAEGRDLLIIEDIIDTGLTLSYLEDTLRARNPRSLAVCALLDKPDCRKIPVVAKYVGFTIPNEFVVGYGLDLDEKYRNLPYIGILKK